MRGVIELFYYHAPNRQLLVKERRRKFSDEFVFSE